MRDAGIRDLADCTEFRQTLLAHPPAIAHGTLGLLAVVLGAALAWSALVRADLVVRAPGRVRPVTAPMKVFTRSGGRVVEVRCAEGAEVSRGDVLIRLDTERLDNEIARRKRTIQAGEEELAKLAALEELLSRQRETARLRAEAELSQALEEARQAKARREADVRLAGVEVTAAADEEARVRRLVGQRAASESDLVRATARLQEAREKQERARLAVDEGRVAILKQALALVDRDDAVRRGELAVRQRGKQGEVEAARGELANLELERRQAVLTAPVDGVVTRGEVKAGDVLEPGKPVVEVAEQKGYLFELMVSSDEVGHLRLGMPARVKLDAYDYQKYGTLAGEVLFISPDSQIPGGQPGAVYLVKIAVAGEEVGRGGLRGRVKLGMAGQAEIVTGRESLLALLLKQVRRTISLG